MARLGLVITDEMESALDKESEKTRIPKSELVRIALEEYLERRGHELKERLGWGGKRERAGESE